VPTSYVPLAFAAALTTAMVLIATSWLAMRQRVAEVAALVMLRIRHWRDTPHASVRRARGAAWHAEAMGVVGRRRDRAVLLTTSVAAWTADGLCLYCALRATGADIGLDVLLLAYTLGIIASMVPLLPAGIGVVETVTPLVLHAYGVPLPTAVAAVLGFRVLGTVLPALAGTVALAGLRIGQPAASQS
jgi:putative heme transporter